MARKKTKEEQEAQAVQRLFDGYLKAVQYLGQVASGKMQASRDRVRVCMFLIEQERGRAKQMIEASGQVTLRVVEDG